MLYAGERSTEMRRKKMFIVPVFKKKGNFFWFRGQMSAHGWEAMAEAVLFLDVSVDLDLVFFQVFPESYPADAENAGRLGLVAVC